MTVLQARILYEIVRYAKVHGMQVPTARYLADQVASISSKPRSAERNMSSHMNRLDQHFHCFRTEGRQRFVRADELLTEPESAAYVLEVVDRAEASPEGRVDKNKLHTEFESRHSMSSRVLEEILRMAVKNQYLELVTSAPGFVRPGIRARTQLPYLNLLVGKSGTPLV